MNNVDLSHIDEDIQEFLADMQEQLTEDNLQNSFFRWYTTKKLGWTYRTVTAKELAALRDEEDESVQL